MNSQGPHDIPGETPEMPDPFAPLDEMEKDTAHLNGRIYLGAPIFSDESITLEFVERYGYNFRYCTELEAWFAWDGIVWKQDSSLLTEESIRNCLRETADRVTEKPGLARSIAAAGRLTSVQKLSRTDKRINTSLGAFDAEPMLLNTPDGVIDLTTGKLAPSQRDYLMTRVTHVGPNNMAIPLWLKFLDEITLGDKELIAYLQRMAGYCLTSSIKEHALFFLYGTGTNGKSVFISTLHRIMGGYTHMSPIETFLASHTERHPQGLASLRGARMVWTTETEEGRRWDQARIAGITGGDPITARFMRQNEFTFLPQFKLIAIGNFKPVLRSVNAAMRRRMNLIPFMADFTGHEDLDLADKLLREAPGILRWCINGCLEWLKHGLNPPDVIKRATAKYLDDEDLVQSWIDSSLTTVPIGTSSFISQPDLFHSWESFAKARGDYVGTMKRFTSAIEAHGLVIEFDPDTNQKGAFGYAFKNAEASGVSF